MAKNWMQRENELWNCLGERKHFRQKEKPVQRPCGGCLGFGAAEDRPVCLEWSETGENGDAA